MEKNGRSDNSAICGGLAASQEAEARRKECLVDFLGMRRYPEKPATIYQSLLRTAGSYAVATLVFVPFISHSA
jgi:hypothetical protein